jgi:hypothetical protein
MSRVEFLIALRVFFFTLAIGTVWFALVCAISGAAYPALMFLLSAAGDIALGIRASARIRQLRIDEFTALLTRFAVNRETGERLAVECERADPGADVQSRTWGLYVRIR